MSVVEKRLKDRSQNKCELCGNDHDLSAYQVPPVESDAAVDNTVYMCSTCKSSHLSWVGFRY